MKTSPKTSALSDRSPTPDLVARQAIDLELIVRIRAGDERSVEHLLHRYRWLATYRARANFLKGSTEEDVAQEAMIGLFKAICDFNVMTETPFAAFADLCIQRQIATAVKAANRYKHSPLNSALSLEWAANSDEGSDMNIVDTLAGPPSWDPCVAVISSEQIESIRNHVFQTLSVLENNVLQLSLQGLSYTQIADTLGAHCKKIDNALQRIRTKLRTHLAQQEVS